MLKRSAIVNVTLLGGRVTGEFRAALFAAAAREGVSVNEYVLVATAEKLLRSGADLAGLFVPGDLKGSNDNVADLSRHRAVK